MPSPIVVDPSHVVNVFAELEADLRRLIRRHARGVVGRREVSSRIAEEIVTLVRSRWDNAPSLFHWWSQMDGSDLSLVGLNSLYDRVADLGVNAKRVLLAVARSYRLLAHPLLIIDDTSAQKYGIWMDGVSAVHVANVPGSVMGHTIVTLMLAGDDGALFVDHRLKVNPKKPRLARHAGRPPESLRRSRDTKKWEMALEMINQARRSGLDQAWVLFDCWYLNVTLASTLTSRGVTFITKAKSNTPVIIDGQKMTAKQFHAVCKSYKRVRQTDHFFYQKAATLTDGTPVKLVATWFFRDGSLKTSLAVLITNNLDIPGAEVVVTYLTRWRTERGYQDWKRSLGGMAYHATDHSRIQNYVWIGFIAYALAKEAQRRLDCDLGVPTVLAVRRRAVRNLIPTASHANSDTETMMARAA